jgi:diaminopimelate epimerase
MEAVGNDFVLLNETDVPSADWPRVAQALCSRHFGIGSDGLLVMGESAVADARMRMFNPDGTEDHCGNGMRCAALYAVRDVPRNREKRLTLETLAGVKSARAFWADERLLVETEMGEPMFAPADLPMCVEGSEVIDYPLKIEGRTFPITVLSTGSLHTVLFVSEAEVEERFDRLSPLLEHHPLFPERTSVMWATVERKDRIRLRIWERGVGETLGCGTGACATMIAARLHGYVGDRVTVASRGGALEAFWPGHGSCSLTGTAQAVFKGCWTGAL